MNVIDRDREILQSIDPQKLRDYLQSYGWHEDRPFLENATIWLKQEGDRGEFEILLPNRQDLGDYVPRIREAIATLSEVENRSQLEILSALTPIPNLTLQGVIVQIYAPNSDKLRGEVILLCALADRLYKIHAELLDKPYIVAIKAYQERISVFCVGDLVNKNNNLILKNIREFYVNEAEIKVLK